MRGRRQPKSGRGEKPENYISGIESVALCATLMVRCWPFGRKTPRRKSCDSYISLSLVSVLLH